MGRVYLGDIQPMESDRTDYKLIEFASSTQAVEQTCRQLVDEIEASSFDESDVFAIHLALEEALTNASKHGNGLDPAKKVIVRYSISDAGFDITVTDEGPGFTVDELPDPRDEENLFKYGGRGVLLMQSYMDVVDFNEKGNEVHMVKNRTTSNQA